MQAPHQQTREGLKPAALKVWGNKATLWGATLGTTCISYANYVNSSYKLCLYFYLKIRVLSNRGRTLVQKCDTLTVPAIEFATPSLVRNCHFGPGLYVNCDECAFGSSNTELQSAAAWLKVGVLVDGCDSMVCCQPGDQTMSVLPLLWGLSSKAFREMGRITTGL